MNLNIISKENVSYIHVSNNKNLNVTLTTFGGSIFRIDYLDKTMTLTNKNYKDFYESGNYYGKTIGRIANRIKDGEVIINNKTYQMDKNEGNNCLHSGKDGWSHKIFDISIIETKQDYIEVTFSYLSKDNEQGLPGNVKILVTYKIYLEEDIIDIEFKAKSDKDTVLALTNHSFFSLGEEDLSALKLTIKASKYVECGVDDLLPLKEKEVTNVLDFRKKKSITKQIKDPSIYNGKAHGYDHDYLFDEVGLDKQNFVLESNSIKLDVRSDFESCQIYSCNYETNSPVLTSNENIYQGIAIEAQDSLLNRRQVKANETYQRTIRYIFSKN
ncbi:MAG: hypothetical protein ACI31G_03980 [Bacilli bacterium]